MSGCGQSAVSGSYREIKEFPGHAIWQMGGPQNYIYWWKDRVTKYRDPDPWNSIRVLVWILTILRKTVVIIITGDLVQNTKKGKIDFIGSPYSLLHGLPYLFSYLNLWEPGNQAFLAPSSCILDYVEPDMPGKWRPWRTLWHKVDPTD